MTIEEIANIIVHAINEEPPLQQGLSRRDKIREHLADPNGNAADNPYPYRTDFIKNTALSCIDTMHDRSVEFNNKYPNDQVSAADLIDVTLTTLDMLVKRLGYKGLDIQGKTIKIV